MTSPSSIIICLVFLLLSISNLNAQNSLLADNYVLLADDFKKSQQPDSAIIYYERAAEAYQRLGNIEKFVNAYNQIGMMLTRHDEYARAKTYLDKALTAGLSSLEPDNLVVATTYISLGVNFNAQGDYDQSLLHHHKALSIRLSRLGEYHADVATSYGNIGNVHFNSKEYDQAIEAHLKAMKIREQLFGATGVEVIQSYTNLGNAYREKGYYQAALDYYKKALENKILQLGDGHKDLVRYYKNLSGVYYLMENAAKGDEYRFKWEEIEKGSGK